MYLQNKYTRWYYNIIERARTRTLEGYSEKHHIIPRSMGGSDGADNLVRLTAREHYICHLLLVKMVDGQDRSKLALAATKMWQKGKNQQRNYHFNSKVYENLKQQASAYLSELNCKRWQDPEYRAIMARRKGRPNPNNKRQIVHTEYTKKLMRQKRLEYLAKKRGTLEGTS
jgi:hypothetical protein